MNFSCLALTAILQFEFIEISLNYFQQASFAFIPPKYFWKSYHLNSKVWTCVADPRVIVLAVHRKANNLQIWVGLKSKWWTQSTFCRQSFWLHKPFLHSTNSCDFSSLTIPWTIMALSKCEFSVACLNSETVHSVKRSSAESLLTTF